MTITAVSLNLTLQLQYLLIYTAKITPIADDTQWFSREPRLNIVKDARKVRLKTRTRYGRTTVLLWDILYLVIFSSIITGTGISTNCKSYLN